MKVLKRRDSSSLVVGVVLGLIISNFVSGISLPISQAISAVSNPNSGFRDNYLLPTVMLIVEVVVLELAVWLWCWASTQMKNKPQV